MRTFAAVFVDDWTAFFVDPVYVLPPELRSALSLHFLKKTDLAKIFRNNFLTTDHRIWWLYSAIPAPTIAVLADVPFVTVRAVPKNVVRGKCYVFTKRFLYFFKIFEEIHGAIWAGSHPEVPINFSTLLKRWDKLGHQDNLLSFLFSRFVEPIQKLLPICSGDEHRGNTDAATGAVVTHLQI